MACDGYSALTCIRCCFAGLNCIAIGGMRANQGIHAWNWVKIGDYYFIMDLTGSETQLDWMLCGMKEPDGSVNSVFDEYEEGPLFSTPEVAAKYPRAEYNFRYYRQIGSYIDSGVVGTSGGGLLEWSLLEGELKKTGEGAMRDFANENDVPWRSYADNISRITVADTVTRRGDNAFSLCGNISYQSEKDRLPANIEIGDSAFSDLVDENTPKAGYIRLNDGFWFEYAGHALTADDLVATANYGKAQAAGGDIGYRYRVFGGDGAWLDGTPVNAGWFCRGDRDFWSILGDWLHPEEPFSMPLKEIFDRARAKGLKCGLWIEIEDVGTECAALPRLGSMLMKSGGTSVCENNRYFLDFSLRETREYATEVIDFLVEKYGVEYFKIDYNADCISGGDAFAESFGDGLLRHNRGYLAWLRTIREKYPDLVIEGCASGGLRSDYATLYECALGNISDQVHYDREPYIVSNAAAYLVPEYTGVWAYPREGASAEEIRMNFVNAAFFRLQLSGALDKMDEEQMREVRDGVAFCESLRDFKRRATAFFPLGFCKFFDETVAYGYRDGDRAYLAVYNLGGDRYKEIPLSFRGEARVAYPVAGGASASVSDGVLSVACKGERDACIVEVRDRK